MNIVKDAFIKSLPILVGYVILGFGFGILLADAGYGVLWALAMSVCIYAGSMQYVGVSLITGPASLLTAAITTLVINARHLFYGLSMIKKYQNTGIFKPYLIFSLTDETYAVISGNQEERPSIFYFFLSFFNHCYWIIGTVLGSCASSLPFNTEGIDFSMTALFVAAYTDQLLKKNKYNSLSCGIDCNLNYEIPFRKRPVSYSVHDRNNTCIAFATKKVKDSTRIW